MWAPSCFHGSVRNGWDAISEYIETQDVLHAKTLSTDLILKRLSDNSVFNFSINRFHHKII